MSMSQSVLVFLIIKCIMKPHFVSVCQQGNFERIILAAYNRMQVNVAISNGQKYMKRYMSLKRNQTVP
jgi:hypothetical protein